MLTLLPFSCAQVSDFGLARLIALQGRITTDTYGTVTHMPPELLTGGDLSPAVVRAFYSPCDAPILFTAPHPHAAGAADRRRPVPRGGAP